MTKHQVPNLQFNLIGNTTEDYNQIKEIDSVCRLIHKQTLSGIREAIKKKLKSVKVVEINSTGYYITIDKENFNSALDANLKHYEDLNEYEICSQIMELKKQL